MAYYIDATKNTAVNARGARTVRHVTRKRIDNGEYDMAPAKAPPYPALWVLTKDGKPPAPWGALARFAP